MFCLIIISFFCVLFTSPVRSSSCTHSYLPNYQSNPFWKGFGWCKKYLYRLKSLDVEELRLKMFINWLNIENFPHPSIKRTGKRETERDREIILSFRTKLSFWLKWPKSKWKFPLVDIPKSFEFSSHPHTPTRYFGRRLQNICIHMEPVCRKDFLYNFSNIQ